MSTNENEEGHHEPEPVPQRERAEAAESHEAVQYDRPRIYVASLSDYNNGLLHGRGSTQRTTWR